MYRPKFCAECSAKIIRLRWHVWTTRRFCERCSPRFFREQVKRAVIAAATMFYWEWRWDKYRGELRRRW